MRAHEFEDLNYFEGCLPIEELARRGRDTLRFGPMKPVGLRDPRTSKMPCAVVQLRKENLRADSYNLVGFQNREGARRRLGYADLKAQAGQDLLARFPNGFCVVND